jgi:hypothetical protein
LLSGDRKNGHGWCAFGRATHVHDSRRRHELGHPQDGCDNRNKSDTNPIAEHGRVADTDTDTDTDKRYGGRPAKDRS